ncbi:pregnancy-specific beta-1-glycoprotein 6-like isoform X2 [Mercenaria mercenaria]|uniref:pregnancy-specific beta-1-glycoprotein 6-like isoform X2 n=1 Tax=Mercenaria mercenaria TaxID=6596 RepID=UPI00234F275A|nr:pregnancy-specific beta-1-glycoprotein 6-like isoform X2 [Mercenaria mercenaria]
MLLLNMRVLSFIPTGLLCLFIFTVTDVEGFASWCEINQTIFVPEESTAMFQSNFTNSYYYFQFYKYDFGRSQSIFYLYIHNDNITDDDIRYYDRSWENRTHFNGHRNTSSNTWDIRIEITNISMKDNGTYRLHSSEDLCLILFVMQIRPEPKEAVEENKPVYLYAHPHYSVITRPLTNASMVWLLDGQSVNKTASFIQQDGLIWIPHITRDLDGRNVSYRAIQDNGNVTEVNYTVNVKYGPNQPLTLVPRQTQYYLVSGDVIPDITCVTECKPRCSISWGKYSSSGTLRLGTVTPKDTGEYTCTATRAGVKTVERTIHIYVSDEKVWLMQLSPNKIVYIVSVGDIMPEIMCTADCNPPCDVSWGVHSSNGQLSLGTVAMGMDAEYICTATRKGSSRRVEKSITVHVQAVACLATVQALTTLGLGLCAFLIYRRNKTVAM